MIKKIFIYSILVLFSTNVAAETLFMKCGESTYKYLTDPSGDKVFWKHPKGTKNKYQEWCQEGPVGKQISKDISSGLSLFSISYFKIDKLLLFFFK